MRACACGISRGGSRKGSRKRSGAAGTGGLIDFAELERRWPEGALEADLAYQQARSWVQLFSARNGWPAVAAVLASTLAAPATPETAREPTLSEGSNAPSPFSRAVLDVTGHPLSDWHADWRRSLSEGKPPWWLWLVQDVGAVVWFLLAVVCGVAFFGLRRRRRRQIAALPDDPLPPGAPGSV